MKPAPTPLQPRLPDRRPAAVRAVPGRLLRELLAAELRPADGALLLLRLQRRGQGKSLVGGSCCAPSCAALSGRALRPWPTLRALQSEQRMQRGALVGSPNTPAAPSAVPPGPAAQQTPWAAAPVAMPSPPSAYPPQFGSAFSTPPAVLAALTPGGLSAPPPGTAAAASQDPKSSVFWGFS